MNKKIVPAHGKHLIMDIYGVSAERLRDARAIKKFFNALPGFLGMRALRPAVLYRVATPDGKHWGLTGFLVLYESHISCHTWPEHGYVGLDLYSCRDFDHRRAIKHLKEFWQYQKAKIKLVKRDDFSVLEKTAKK